MLDACGQKKNGIYIQIGSFNMYISVFLGCISLLYDVSTVNALLIHTYFPLEICLKIAENEQK